MVAEGQSLEVELLKEAGKTLSFDALMVIEDEKISVGAPTVEGAKVSAKVIDPEVKGEKVVAIRYKAKKRVRKVRGHRQRHSVIKISKIT